MGTVRRHGSELQKQTWLPKIASGELRLQSMAVTEPTTGTDTTRIKTTAVKKDGRYVVNGQKVWISRVQHSDLMILLARTTPLDQEIGRAHVWTHVTNAQLVCRLLLAKKNNTNNTELQ